MNNKKAVVSGLKRKCRVKRIKVCKVVNRRAFSVSGVIGGEDRSILIGIDTRQQIAVNIPPRRSLILTNAKYCFNDAGARFVVSFTGTGIIGNAFRSASNCAEERVRFLLFTNTSSSTVTLTLLFRVLALEVGTVLISPEDGWFARFVIR